MNRQEREERTKKFNIQIIRLCGDLPKNSTGLEMSKQLIRSAGSVGANYRATKRTKSDNDFICKIKIVLKRPMDHYIGLR